MINLELMAELRSRKTAMIDKFYQTPRQYDEAEWLRLFQDYESAGMQANAQDVADRIERFRYILENEHTPLTDAPEEREPWQLRVDIE
jgi:hypothetical protein